MCAIGEKITPDTPDSVKSGMKATAMTSVEENIGGPTSPAASRMRSMALRLPGAAMWRNTFSITMTVESTTIPKSTAPSEIRLAGVPVATIPTNAAISASGMLSAVMSAARPCPRNIQSTTATSTIPMSRFSSTVCVVSFTSVARS